MKPSDLLHDLPLNRRGVVVAAAVAGAIVGAVVHVSAGTALDSPFHDAIVAHDARDTWKHTAIVVLDNGVPADVTRPQLLPLLARAADAAVAAGADAVFLDANVLASPDRRIPAARCVKSDGSGVDFIAPTIVEGELVPAPGASMPIALATASKLWMLPPSPPGNAVCRRGELARDEIAPPIAVVGPRAAGWVHFVCSAVPVRTRDLADGVARWTLRTSATAAAALAYGPLKGHADAVDAADVCFDDDDAPLSCARVRFSVPTIATDDPRRPIVALSALADCDDAKVRAAAAPLAGRVVILQTVSFDERADLHATPMSTALLSQHKFAPGAQVIADSIETLVEHDGPRTASLPLALALLVIAAAAGAVAGAWLRATLALLVVFLVPYAVGVASLASPSLSAGATLLPIAGAFVAATIGAFAMLGTHLVLGTRRAQLTARYLPRPVRRLLLTRRTAGAFADQERHAVVLMSDLKGYTTMTGLLKKPSAIIGFLNRYLDDTTAKLPDDHGAWLEGYVGDLVCFYWPADGAAPDARCTDSAVRAALDLAKRQEAFFGSLSTSSEPAMRELAGVVGAGIGLASGTVVMGNLGPRDGVQKFGILGDPLNLSSRLESLTRHFDCRIVASEEVADAAKRIGAGARRLAKVRVKGRLEPTSIYAITEKPDPDAAAWDRFLAAVEGGIDPGPLPAAYKKDGATIRRWVERGLLQEETGAFLLDEK